jgi:hypothetical protein
MSNPKHPLLRPIPSVDFANAVPPTPAEAAVYATRWERRGLLGRLVRAN